MIMKRIAKLIYSNKFFGFILLAFQLFILAMGYIWLVDYNVYIMGATSIIGAVLILYEVNRTDNPDFKTAWIVLIAIIPVFGALLYIYLHIDVSAREMRIAQERAAALTEKSNDTDIADEVFGMDKSMGGLCRFLLKHGGTSIYKNTKVQYFPLGDDFLHDMTEELKKAEHFIFLEYFIINHNRYIWPEMLAVLKEKAKRGVEIRIIFDGMGCMVTLPRNYAKQLEDMGIRCRIFSPIQPLLSTYQNNRDHRKITVIDGRCAYCGGINLADEYANREERFGHWKDTGVRLDGEGVSGLTKLFLDMWNGIDMDDTKETCGEFMRASSSVPAQGFVIPFGDTPLDNVQTGRQVYIDMLNTASRYVHIMTPYLVIDDGMYEAMKYAVQRGVDVRIIMPHIPDKKYMFWLARTYYPKLLAAGVRIFEYVPGFVHAKSAVSDDTKAVVGTINFDYRSMYLHYECAVLMYKTQCVEDIEWDYMQTLDSCVEIDMSIYRRMNPIEKIIGRISRLLAPML